MALEASNLNQALSGHASILRETMAEESDSFQQLFEKITYADGGFGSTDRPSSDNHVATLLHIKRSSGKTEFFEVPLSQDSLDQGDCFILNNGQQIFTWMGSESSPFEKNACALKAENLSREQHGATVIEGDGDARFWKLLGGKGPVSAAF